MTTSKITQEQVTNACNLLVSQNKRVTIDAVRVMLGNVGSKSTIVPMVKNWRQQNPEIAFDSKQLISMPNEVLAKFNEAWTMACLYIEQKSESDSVALLETEIERLKEEIMKYEKMEIKLDILEKTQSGLLESFQKVNEDNGKLKQRIQELEQNNQVNK